MSSPKKTLMLALSVLLVGALAGCTNAPDAKKAGETKDGQTATTTDAAKTEPTTTATGETTGTTATDATAPATGAATETTAATGAAGTTTLAKGGSAIPPQMKVSIDKLPADLTIVTVGKDSIKVSDFRRMMQVQKAQLDASINVNPVMRAQLLQTAQKRGVKLTSDETQRLESAAKEQATKGGKDFTAFLKEKNISEAQYKKEVDNLGLVYKMSNQLLEEGLLPELVNRQLLSSAAIGSGLKKEADKRFDKMKGSDQMKRLTQQTGIPQDLLKDEIVKAELAKMQIERISKGITVNNSELKKVYDANKKNLKHGERIRLASILIAAPDVDQGPILSVRSQVLKANPKLEGKDLDATVAQVIQQQEQKALILLGQAKAGVDFAKLSNENTDDVQARVKKTGGDLGWQEKQQLIPQFADAVWGLKPGTVLPKLVKTQLGYQIIKVMKHEQPGSYSFDEVKPLVEAQVRQAKLQIALQNWLQQQQRQVPVQFSPQFIAVATGKGDGKTATP